MGRHTHNARMNSLHLLSLALSAVLSTGCSAPSSPEEEPPPLIGAAEQGDLRTLNLLLAEKPQPDVRDGCQWTPLMKAALYGHLAVVERLLLLGANVHLADKGGYTALHLAASNNHVRIVRLLLDHGADPNAQETTRGWTPLIWAAKQGHLASVEILLQRGARTTLTDHEGNTALGWAVKGRYTQVIESLVAAASTGK